VQYAVLETIRAVYGIWQIWPSVNRKRLKILRSRPGYIIRLRIRVVVQNLKKIRYLIMARQTGEVSVFFLQTRDRQSIKHFFSSRVICDHIYRNMLMEFKTRVLTHRYAFWGFTTFKFNISHIFCLQKIVKIREK